MIVEANPDIDFDGIVQTLGTPQEISKTFEDNKSLRKTAKTLVIEIIYIIFQSYYFGEEINVNTK